MKFKTLLKKKKENLSLNSIDNCLFREFQFFKSINIGGTKKLALPILKNIL